MKRVVILAFLLAACKASAPDKCCKCKKPEYAPRRVKHLNCLNNKDHKEGLWQYYGYPGLLLAEIYFNDGKIVWTKYYNAKGEVIASTGATDTIPTNTK